MMEESGAKIWIDQESMSENEARVVYVSGKRTSVDSAVRMVKDLVAKAPVASSAATPTGVAPSAPATAPTSAKATPTPSASPPVQPAAEAPKEPTSFAAAISSGASSPAAVTPPVPAVTPTKQPAPTTQGWASSTTTANTHIAPSQAAPQSVKPPPPPEPKPVIRSVLEAGGEKLFPDTVIKELACDPRFVALLIGRRGWTVKNIQTESGADLHIDQTVDPPKIIMSGEADQVEKAEHLVREVLKYPHHQLHQENPNRLKSDAMVNATGNMGISNRPEQNSLGNLQMMPNQPSNPSSMQLPTTSLHRDISSSTPTMLDELQLQQQKSDVLQHLPSGYPQFQQQHQQLQQHQSGNLGLFQDSSAATRISEFVPSNHNQSLNVNPPAQTQSQDSWSHHSQGPAPSRTQQQYSTLPPFNNAQMSSGSDHYLLSNRNTNQPHHHQPPHETIPQRQQQSNFGMPPQDQHLRFPQEPVQHQAHNMPPAQAPSTRMNDYMSAGNSTHSMNGWELPANGSSMGGTWNQSNHASVDGDHRRPSFQAHAPQAPLSNNPFQSQTPHNNFTAPSQPSNNPVSDDSQMVDDLFASLGTGMSLGTSDSDGSGLLNALNSVSLGGVGTQQGSNLGSLISGWTGEDAKNDPFSQQSRLGDYK
jgi:hypothetical protein